MQNRTKNILLAVLIIGLISMTVAYAALTQTLNINTTAKVLSKGESWNVHFNAPSTAVLTGYASVATGKELKLNGTTTLNNLEATLVAPGDSVSYTFDVENSGTINAIIDSVTLPNISTVSMTGSTADVSLVRSNLQFSLVYTSNNKAPAKGDTLAAGETKNMTLKITYNASATNLPSAAVTVSGLDAHIDYKQN